MLDTPSNTVCTNYIYIFLTFDVCTVWIFKNYFRSSALIHLYQFRIERSCEIELRSQHQHRLLLLMLLLLLFAARVCVRTTLTGMCV